MRAALALLLAAAVLAGTAGATMPGANGRIAFTRFLADGTTRVLSIEPNGRGEQPLPLPAQATEPAWSPDGSRILFTVRKSSSEQGVCVARADGTGLRQLTRNTSIDVFDSAPSWSPDGRRIVFVRFAQGGSTVYTMGASGGRLTPVIRSGLGPAWSPDGRWIALALRPAAGEETDIFVVRPNGSERRRLTTSAASDFDADWSPDGKRIVFVSERDGDYEIYVMRADGTQQRRLTRVAVPDVNPAFSPDGRKIAFATRRVRGRLDIFVMNADGTRQTRVTRHPADDADPSWQPVKR